MTTERDTRNRIVLSWLREDAHENVERVLLSALDEVDTTPQRRSLWPAWRSDTMNTYAKLIAAAAAVLVVGVIGYQLLPGRTGPGAPTIAPSPSPTLLAQGTFTSHGVAMQLDATGDGANVAGTLTATDEAGGRWTVDLECSRTTESGLLLIGGEVLSSTQEEFPVGSDTAMIFQRGSPPKAIIHVPLADPPAASCAAFLENLPVDFPEPGGAQLEPIEGSLFLRP